MTKVFDQKTETEKRKILRNSLPKSEIILWNFLKDKQLGGYKFRRQYSVGRIDGDSPFIEDAPEYDEGRQKFIEFYGVRFLRFTNEEVSRNLQKVLEKILSVCIKYES